MGAVGPALGKALPLYTAQGGFDSCTVQLSQFDVCRVEERAIHATIEGSSKRQAAVALSPGLLPARSALLLSRAGAAGPRNGDVGTANPAVDLCVSRCGFRASGTHQSDESL